MKNLINNGVPCNVRELLLQVTDNTHREREHISMGRWSALCKLRGVLDRVSKVRKVGTMPLTGSYYAAECSRCGWIGSSEELTEDAQCLQQADAENLCYGETDEITADVLLGIIQNELALQIHKPLIPDNLVTHRSAWLQAMSRLVELEPQAGVGDTDDKGFWQHERRAMYAMYDDLDNVLRHDYPGIEGGRREYIPLAKMIERYQEAPPLTGSAIIARQECAADKLAEISSASRAALLETALAGLLLEFDDGVNGGRDYRVPALDLARTLVNPKEEPSQGIPGTSGARLNMLANEGE